MFRDGVQEEPLDPSLVENYLLEPRDPRDCVWDSVTTLDSAVAVWVPQIDLKHVVRFAPDAVGEVEAVEDFETAALQAVGLAVEDLRGSVSSWYGIRDLT